MVCSRSRRSGPGTLRSELDPEVEFGAAVEVAGGDSVESFGDVDLAVECGEAFEFLAVFVGPCVPVGDGWREIGDSGLDAGELGLVAGDLGVEPRDRFSISRRFGPRVRRAMGPSLLSSACVSLRLRTVSSRPVLAFQRASSRSRCSLDGS